MTLKEALDYLCEKLRREPDYFYAWQSNIAMIFLDEINQNRDLSLSENANNAAKQFLNQLIGSGVYGAFKPPMTTESSVLHPIPDGYEKADFELFKPNSDPSVCGGRE